MSLNSLTVKKFLLTAGLLIVLGQGVWKLPELQDYLFPVENVHFIVRQASKECPRIKEDLRMLNERIDYLKWFQNHDGPNQKFLTFRVLSFPFSESIRLLAPRYFWQINIRLAHQTRVKVERKLVHLDTVLKNIDADFKVGGPHDTSVIPAKPASSSDSMQQIHQFQAQCSHYNAQLEGLTQQLTYLDSNVYKNQSAGR